MTAAGWITMILCWSFVTGLSVYLVVKTLRVPPHRDDDSAEP
jgi:hypothetical protein